MNNDRFEMFARFSEGLLKYTLDALVGSGSKNRESNMILILALIVILFIFIALIYAGVETVKLLSRKNFGRKGVSVSRTIISTIIFLTLAYFSYDMYADFYLQYENYGSKDSFLFTSIIFLVVSIIVLFKGILSKFSDNQAYNSIYRGDSNLLGFLIKGGWNQSTIQDFAEPLLFLAFGVYFYSFNFICGLPFIFCAISTWLHLGIESVFGFFSERKELTNNGYSYTQNREFSKVAN